MQGDESVIPDAASIMTNYEINKDNQWGWITLYVVTIVIAVLGNLLFIVSSLCTKRTRTTGKNCNYKSFVLYPSLDLVKVVVGHLLFTKSRLRCTILMYVLHFDSSIIHLSFALH